jgi:hypothetical protein
MRNVKPGTGGALLGLAAIALLGATLLAVVSRSVAGPASGATDVRLGWQVAARPPGAVPAARPVALGSGLVVLTSDGSAQVIGDVSVSAWSSPDGSNWSRLSQPGAISEPGRSISLVAACPDGHGGLVAAGTSAIAADPSLALKAAIWHSSDGRTWDLATWMETLGPAWRTWRRGTRRDRGGGACAAGQCRQCSGIGLVFE